MRLSKIFKINACLTAGIITFGSCVNKDDFFLLKDRSGIDAAIWSTEGAVQMHLNRTYDVVMPRFGYDGLNNNVMSGRWGVHWASDENILPAADVRAAEALGMTNYVMGSNDVRWAGNLYTANFGANKYMDIARCNNAIQYIPEGSLPNSLKKQFMGQYYALRAMTYFGLAKVYGGVPLVLEPQDPQNVKVRGRASAAEVFKTIVRDLDSAMVNLNGVTWDDATGRGKISRAAAAALKAKVLMYWASPQFNPISDPKHPYDPNRWNIALEANKEAYEICKAAGHDLLPDYSAIFTTEGSANVEAIMVRTYSSTIERRGHDEEYKNRPRSEGGSPNLGYRPTLKLMKAYPMKDGNAITAPGAYTYNDKLFWKDRDPRFEASIAYNGSVWNLSSKNNRKQWTYVGATEESGTNWGAYFKRFTTPNLASGSVRYQSGLGGSGMDWIEMRFAEVILNYAECANETNNLALAKEMVRLIRKRAKIEEGGANDYGLGSINSKEDMRDLIFNERFIEFAMENKRNSDLRRTRRMHLLNGQEMEAIEIKLQTGVTKEILETNNFRETLDLNDEAVYDQYFQPYSVVKFGAHGLSTLNAYSIPEFHYFYTFNNDWVLRGVDVDHTIGWGGNFDPLDGQ